MNNSFITESLGAEVTESDCISANAGLYLFQRLCLVQHEYDWKVSGFTAMTPALLNHS
jgi:hypothetical protein